MVQQLLSNCHPMNSESFVKHIDLFGLEIWIYLFKLWLCLNCKSLHRINIMIDITNPLDASGLNSWRCSFLTLYLWRSGFLQSWIFDDERYFSISDAVPVCDFPLVWKVREKTVIIVRTFWKMLSFIDVCWSGKRTCLHSWSTVSPCDGVEKLR